MKLRNLALVAALLAASSGAWAATPPPQLAQDLSPLYEVEEVAMPLLDNAALLNRANQIDPGSGPLRFAEAHKLDITPDNYGLWEKMADGTHVWRLRLFSETAKSLNLGFGRYKMPAGGKLFIYTPDYRSVVGPFTEADNASHGELWTPLVPGEEMIIEVQVPERSIGDLQLALTNVNHAFRLMGIGEEFETENARSGSCNVDVVCPQGDPYRDQIRSSGAYTVGGTDTCSGALINNTAQDSKPYFLTANHCGLGTGNAASVVVYWNYQNSTCRTPGSGASGGAGNGSLAQFNSGAFFRASNATSDFCLIEMDSPILPAVDPYFSGWDRNAVDFAGAIAIHHPQVEEKRISFENDATATSTYLGTTSPGDGTHVRIIDWDLGTTEPGSSGSPLYNPAKRIIGQLHGGTAACGNNESDYYGRLSRSWTGGGTNSTRLSNWLDPTNSGVTVMDGRGLSIFQSNGAPTVDDSTSDNDGVLEPGEPSDGLTFSVKNVGTLTATNVVGTLTSLTPTVAVTQGNSTFPNITAAGNSANTTPFTISISPAHDCGEPIRLRLEIDSTEEVNSFLDYELSTGPTCNIVPDFTVGTVVVDDSAANGTGAADPGETVFLSVPLNNVGAPATAISAVLSTSTPGVTVVPASSTSAYPNIGTGAAAANTVPYSISVDSGFVCGNAMNFTMTVTTAAGTDSADFSLTSGTIFPVNFPVSQMATSGVAFGDSPLPASVTKNVVFAVNGVVTDVNVTLNMTHTFDGDVIATIVAPNGATATLSNRNGGTGENFVNTVFDDEAALAIAGGSAPFTGSFRPDSPLTALDGSSVEGTWAVTLSDAAGGDNGTFNNVTISLQYNPKVCGPATFFGPDGPASYDDTAGNGNGNGVLDSGEDTIEVTIPVRNLGQNATNVFGTLTTSTAGVTVSTGLAPYGSMGGSTTSSNTAPFVLSLSPSFVCGTPISLSLDMDSDQGGNGDFAYGAPTGNSAPGTESHTVTPNVAVGPNADLDTITIPFTGNGLITDVDVTISMLHTYMGDVSIRARNPGLTEVLLFNRRDGTNENMSNTLFDDSASAAIASGTAPFTGSFRPEAPLSGLNAGATAGNWTVLFQDHATGDGGTIQSVKIDVDYNLSSCAPVLVPGSSAAASQSSSPIPSGGGHDYGTVAIGSPTVSRTFRVDNPGSAGLITANLAVPAGYVVAEPLSANIAAGSFDDFTIDMPTAQPGPKNGALSFDTSAAGNFHYTINLTGTVTPPASVDEWDMF